jgi:hypothetical protein
MALILPDHGTCEKNERGFCSSARYGEKPLSVFKNSCFFSESASEDDMPEQKKMDGF